MLLVGTGGVRPAAAAAGRRLDVGSRLGEDLVGPAGAWSKPSTIGPSSRSRPRRRDSITRSGPSGVEPGRDRARPFFPPRTTKAGTGPPWSEPYRSIGTRRAFDAAREGIRTRTVDAQRDHAVGGSKSRPQPGRCRVPVSTVRSMKSTTPR